MGRVQQFVSHLIDILSGRGADATDENQHGIEQLAEAIMEHGRMTHDAYPAQETFVIVKGLAYRFREDPAEIIQALLLLESRNQAVKTAPHEWKLLV